MGKLTVGRVGLDVDFDSVRTIGVTGDRLSLSGRLARSLTFAQAQALRQQVAGLVDNRDEPVVPLTFEDDGRLDGFYRVESAEVDAGPGGKRLRAWPWSMTLTRVQGFGAPQVESILLAPDVLDNDHSLTATDSNHWHGLPAAAQGYGESDAGEFDRDSADGTIKIRDTSVLRNSTPDYQLFPGDWYAGAARINLDWDGTLFSAVGRQVDAREHFRTTLANGLFRWALSGDQDEFRFTVQRWTGSGWSAPKEWRLEEKDPLGTPKQYPATSVTVLRNAPEEVSVRYYMARDDRPIFFVIDVTLKRGAPWVAMRIHPSHPGSGDVGMRIRRTTDEAGTTITAGMKASAADSDGLFYTLLSREALTGSDATVGAINVDVGGDWNAMVGLANADDAGDESPEGLRAQWIAGMDETQRVAAR